MNRLIISVMALTAGACESGPRSTEPESPAMPPRRVMHGHMRAHLDAARDMQRAIALGRVDEARRLAVWFMTHDDSMDPPPAIDRELERAAEVIARSRTPLEAAGGMARFGAACASCHLAYGASVAATIARFSPPAESSDIRGQMARHEWAAERLWVGMSAPSDVAWKEGAELLASTSIDLASTTNAKPNETVVELAERLHEYAIAARAATDPAVRSPIYGKVLVTCARCHSIVRNNPVVRAE